MQRRQGPIVLERSARLKFENTPTDWVGKVDGGDWLDVAHRYAIFLCSLDVEYMRSPPPTR